LQNSFASIFSTTMGSLPGTTLPPDYVKKYAPSVKFHGMERVFPCDIEYLVQGGTLNYRPWSEAAKVGSQRTGVPAVVAFNKYIYMVYTGAHDAEIWVTRSQDGITWTDMHQIGQQTSVPAIAVFKDKLWITYSGHHSAQVRCYPLLISSPLPTTNISRCMSRVPQMA
jgi:hypothetical protein